MVPTVSAVSMVSVVPMVPYCVCGVHGAYTICGTYVVFGY